LSQGQAQEALAVYHRAFDVAVNDAHCVGALAGMGRVGSAESLPRLELLLDQAAGPVREAAVNATIAIAGQLFAAYQRKEATRAYQRISAVVPEGGESCCTATPGKCCWSTCTAARWKRSRRPRRWPGISWGGTAWGRGWFIRWDQRALHVRGKLRALGVKMELVSQGGVVSYWWLIGPFPSPNEAAWRREFFPEQEINLTKEYDFEFCHCDVCREARARQEINLTKEYDFEGRKLLWQLYHTADRDGIVDLK
jgi:hypothetical protein